MQVLRDSSKLIHAVLGNGTCDLDSAMSSLVYAYYLQSSGDRMNSVHHVPVLNVHRDRYNLLTDVQHVLNQCGLSDPTLLTFRDDIDFESLCKCSRLQLTLVDCHVLPPPDNALDNCVVEVIDHRPRAQPDRPKLVLPVLSFAYRNFSQSVSAFEYSCGICKQIEFCYIWVCSKH
jgi:hypothetical protein